MLMYKSLWPVYYKIIKDHLVMFQMVTMKTGCDENVLAVAPSN